MNPRLERKQFLGLAIAVEGGLIVLAIALAWWLKIPLESLLVWNLAAIVWGVAATIPCCLVFGLTYWKPVGSYRRIKDFLFEALGPSLAACRWYELLLVAALAGVGEELLFRGFFQQWLLQWDYLGSLLVSNLVFGLLHAVTITYAVLAFLMGLLMGLLLDAPPESSLLAPMLTHGLYDYFAFSVLAADWRRQKQKNPEQAEPLQEDSISSDQV